MNFRVTVNIIIIVIVSRFLCDFIYYSSLKNDRSRAAFIHVPTLEKFPKEDIAAGVEMAIKEMYWQVKERDMERESQRVTSSVIPVVV